MSTRFGEIFSYSFNLKKVQSVLAVRGVDSQRDMKLAQPVWMARDYKNNLVFVQRNQNLAYLAKQGLQLKIQYLVKDVFHHVEKVVIKMSKDKKLVYMMSNEMPQTIKLIDLESLQIKDFTLQGLEKFKNQILDFDIFLDDVDSNEDIQLRNFMLWALVDLDGKQKVVKWSYTGKKVEVFEIFVDKNQAKKVKITSLKSINVDKSGSFVALNGNKRLALAKFQNGELNFLVDEENPEKIDYEGDQVNLQFLQDKKQYSQVVGDSKKYSNIFEKSEIIVCFQMFFRAKGDYELHYLAVQSAQNNDIVDYGLVEVKKEVHIIDEFWMENST